MQLLAFVALCCGILSISYPDYIPSNATCIFQLESKADAATVLGTDAVSLGIPDFYTLGCFSQKKVPEEPSRWLTDGSDDTDEDDGEDDDNENGGDNSDDDDDSLSYDEKISILEELASRDGVIAVYPDIPLTVKTPATLTNFSVSSGSSSSENCTSPAHDFLWYITGEYHVPDSKKVIKTVDINITDVWERNYTGKGTTIQMLLTGGISKENIDLSGRLNYDLSRNFTNATLNATSDLGTALAALAVGDRCNEYGGEGIAPDSNLVVMAYNESSVLLSELLIGLSPATYLKHLNATNSNSSNYKTSIIATSFLLDGCSSGCCAMFDDLPWISTIMTNSALENSAVYLFTVGEEGHTDSNIYPFLRNPGAIVVGSVTPEGKPDNETTFGSNIVFSIPTNGTVDGVDLSLITSTSPSACDSDNSDSSDNPWCLTSVNGPAGSLSLASGAIAVIGQALNNKFNIRDILHIMAVSSQTVNNSTQFNEKHGWVLNGNGFFFSNKYGFGLLNITKAVDLAEKWSPLPNATYASYDYNETEKLKSNDSFDVHITVPEKDMMRLERVQVALSLTTGFAGDITIDVTSPAGTVNRILGARKADISDNLSDNVFLLSNAFFGESSPGDWKIRIHNGHKTSSAKITSVKLMITGVPQTTHLTFAKSYNKIYGDDTVHLKWRPTTCGFTSTSTVDFWIVDRFHSPVALVASNISYSDYEYKWDAFKIPLEKDTRGFFMMVPHDTANITPHQWLPSHVFSPMVRFHLEDSESAAGAFMRPSMTTVTTIAAILAVSALILK